MKLGRLIIFLAVLALLSGGVFMVFRSGAVFNEGVTAANESSDNGVEVPVTETEQQVPDRPEERQEAGDEPYEAGTQVSDSEVKEQEISQGKIKKPELRFMAMGDLMIGRGVGARLKKAGSYEKAFEKVHFYLELADIVFANLEAPFTESRHSLDSKRKIVLKAHPDAVSALTSAGINFVSLANNHIMDYYEKGLFDTIDLLDKYSIAHAGAGKDIDEARKPAIIEKNGLKIGLLAYTDMAELVFAGNPYLSFAAGEGKPGVAPRKYEIIKEDILKVRDQVDLLAVSLHWGIEDSFRVTPEQVEFAHKLIDDGVDVILGHHPHQFQGIEIYNGKPIFYSLGNILFDQNDPENMEGFIVDMKYEGTELVECAAIPVRIMGKTHVEILTGDNAAELLEREVGLCRELGTEPSVEEGRLVFSNGN